MHLLLHRSRVSTSNGARGTLTPTPPTTTSLIRHWHGLRLRAPARPHDPGPRVTRRRGGSEHRALVAGGEVLQQVEAGGAGGAAQGAVVWGVVGAAAAGAAGSAGAAGARARRGGLVVVLV